MENYIGKRLDGRYEIQEIIGVGTISVVYKALDNVEKRYVAVKIINPEYTLKNRESARKYKELQQRLQKMPHDNIVKVYDVSFGDIIQYIVMEYIDSITLIEYINKQGAITWNDALFFMAQILKAVQHAHENSIIHGDLKSQKIMLTSSGYVKVADFGIYLFLEDDNTKSKHFLSSQPYKAPRNLTYKSDIYSLGVILFEMLIGNIEKHQYELYQFINETKNLCDFQPNIPKSLNTVCYNCIQESPNDRYASAKKMLDDINKIINSTNSSIAVTKKSIYNEEKPKGHNKDVHFSNQSNNKKKKSFVHFLKRKEADVTDSNEKIEPYLGKQKYIFISYSHKNENEVYGIISHLQNQGYRIWFDNGGIPPGSEYDKIISEKVLGCEYLLAFVNNHYIQSRYCKKELMFADRYNKNILLIYLSPTKLPSEMDLHFGHLQNIQKYNYNDESGFYSELTKTRGLDKCKEL